MDDLVDIAPDTIAPDSDQLDAHGQHRPSAKRAEDVHDREGHHHDGLTEQPVSITLTEFDRVWRPNKSMRRVLVACWGTDASQYVGRRVRLYCDPKVRFGGQEVGGTRISHLSDLDKPKEVVLLESRGKAGIFVVQPLVEATEDRVAEYKIEWKTADAERRKVIEAEVARLTNPDVQSQPEAGEDVAG
jgi:hypothetical protein